MTVNVSWQPGDKFYYEIFVIADPELVSGGSIPEENESNNYAFTSIIIGSYNMIFGNMSGVLNIKQNETNRTVFEWLPFNFTGTNIYAADYESIISWSSLKPLGRSTANISEFDDFDQLDIALQMENNSDDINATWTIEGSPRETRIFSIFGKTIDMVPVVNSTNISDFTTGIMWDSSDPSMGGRFSGTQDVVFVTTVSSNTEGAYGIYDFEFKIPSNLKLQKTTNTGSIVLYTEIK